MIWSCPGVMFYTFFIVQPFLFSSSSCIQTKAANSPLNVKYPSCNVRSFPHFYFSFFIIVEENLAPDCRPNVSAGVGPKAREAAASSRCSPTCLIGGEFRAMKSAESPCQLAPSGISERYSAHRFRRPVSRDRRAQFSPTLFVSKKNSHECVPWPNEFFFISSSLQRFGQFTKSIGFTYP